MWDIDEKKYDRVETVQLTGTTGSIATASLNIYPGFSFSEDYTRNITQGTIVGNGSLVMRMYYDRDEVRLNYKVKDDMSGINLTGLEENVIISENEKKNALSISLKVQVDKIEDSSRLEILNIAKENLREVDHELLYMFNISIIKAITKLNGSFIESELPNDEIKGLITVKIPIPENLKGKSNLAVSYIDNEGKVEILETEKVTIEGTEYLQFKTDHFSLYAIVELAINQELPQTKASFIQYLLGILLLGAGIIFVVLRKRAVRD